ncbi:MAG: 4-(cytidine 5'-diphospho)-2-C-methyl-D-erythritol kinase [Chitinophagaceae bacterium]
MVVFPNCKINLGLHITAKRLDGYHDLETVFYPIALNDVLEVVRLNEASSLQNSSIQNIQFTSSGIPIDGDVTNNLCVKAYQLLQRDFPDLPPIQMHLHKIIPMGAGLGGGSADGAFALSLLQKKFHLTISEEQMIAYALQLGSDCPFFVINKPCFATGRGEIINPISLDLSDFAFVIVNPRIHISTGWAFNSITPKKPQVSIKDIIIQPITTWKNLLINDFELPAIQQFPIIGTIKDTLYDYGAVYSSMTGSGSTIFGIFHKKSLPEIQFQEDFFVETIL